MAVGGSARPDESTESAMTSSVATFKLHPPAQPPHLLTRPRLLRRLDAATEPVVVLSAPAGAGKTVLLTEWSQGLAARGECAWLSLDAYDNAPGRLWSCILRAVHHVRPNLPGRLDSDGWTVDAWIEEILPDLVTGLGGEGPLTLILDGLESITDADAVRSLADFLTRLPPVSVSSCRPGTFPEVLCRPCAPGV